MLIEVLFTYICITMYALKFGIPQIPQIKPCKKFSSSSRTLWCLELIIEQVLTSQTGRSCGFDTPRF